MSDEPKLIKLKIVPEKKGAKLQFDEKRDGIDAMFNPDELSFSSSVGWSKQNAKGRDVPELQFTTSEPRSLSVKLLFDTYDTPDPGKLDVRREYTDRILKLTLVDNVTHRPPVCRLQWGEAKELFQGVLERLDQKFTMFMDNGTPVRATLSCTFKEWRLNEEDRKRQGLESSDIAKTRIVKRGDTLSSIAAEEYLNPALWRPIGLANGIDDPLRLEPGRALLVPRLPGDGESAGKRTIVR